MSPYLRIRLISTSSHDLFLTNCATFYELLVNEDYNIPLPYAFNILDNLWSSKILHSTHVYSRYCLFIDTNVNELTEVVVLKAEISRLQEQLKDVEKQNKFLNEKLTQQQWDMDHRLAEIEMQICRDTSSVGSSIDDNERNRESVI